MYKTCEQCGRVIPTQAVFCPQCGKPQHGQRTPAKGGGWGWKLGLMGSIFFLGALLGLLFFRTSSSSFVSQEYVQPSIVATRAPTVSTPARSSSNPQPLSEWQREMQKGLAGQEQDSGAPSVSPPAASPSPVPATAPPVVSAPAATPAQPPRTMTGRATALDGLLAGAVRTAVARQSFEQSRIAGGAFAKTPFAECAPDGVLIGLRLGIGKFFSSDVIKSVQPIYLTPRGEQLGQLRGFMEPKVLEAKAPPGYAVGAVRVCGGGGLDSIVVTFMRIRGESLDPNDSETTVRIGGNGGGGPVTIGGDGTPIIGICGRIAEPQAYMGLGMIFMRPTETAQRH